MLDVLLQVVAEGLGAFAQAEARKEAQPTWLKIGRSHARGRRLERLVFSAPAHR